VLNLGQLNINIGASMKNFLLILLATSSAALALPSTSHALVMTLASCTTADGTYQVSIYDNQGIGFQRKSNISASITIDGNTVVGSYPVELYQGMSSASFGRAHYQDTATQGKFFLLEGPSTNFRHYSLHATLDGNEIADDNLTCTVFGGKVLH
jgi:hypothetical protein